MEDKRAVTASKPRAAIDPAKAALNKTLETAAWGAFLILLGLSFLVPESRVKDGWWSVGLGLIFLGLNLARYLNGLRMSGFTTFLGVISLAGGLLGLIFRIDVDGPIFLIALGAYLMLKPYFDRRGVFGKAEQA
jgi:hypothetical protein